MGVGISKTDLHLYTLLYIELKRHFLTTADSYIHISHICFSCRNKLFPLRNNLFPRNYSVHHAGHNERNLNYKFCNIGAIAIYH